MGQNPTRPDQVSVSEVALNLHQGTPSTGNMAHTGFRPKVDQIYKHFRLHFELILYALVPLHIDYTWHLGHTFHGQKIKGYPWTARDWRLQSLESRNSCFMS